MRATALEVNDDDTALVELRPCRIARWLGARTTVAWLQWLPQCVGSSGGDWHFVDTGRPLHRSLPEDARILRALEFRPVPQLPRATVADPLR